MLGYMKRINLMAKYRKKPIVIEAEQWLGYVAQQHGEQERRLGLLPSPFSSTMAQINTLEGPLSVSPGDWIITGIKGEKYPCKDEIFKESYERVE
jgi:hypothetical protein